MSFLAPTSLKNILRALGFAVAALGVASAQATIIEFQTNMDGRKFTVNLYDKATPETVKNFLAYLSLGAYENVVVHRSARKDESTEKFVIQTGGYTYSGTFPLGLIASRRDVDDIDHDGNKNEVLHPINEPKFSNIKGTIAMAKKPNAPNSATSEWFINIEDNSEILDAQNGGFTVFGEVIDGMDVVNDMDVVVVAGVVNDIAKLNRFRTKQFSEIPLQNYSVENARNNDLVTEDNLVIITDIVVIDEREDTAYDLTPTPNILVKTAKDDDSSGSIGLLSLLLLAGLSLSSLLRSNRT